MPFLRNCWLVAAWADEVGPGQMLARTIADTPVVIWRSDDGRLLSLFDRCAHRLAPLSKGILCDTAVRCNYHGLAYDGATGRCVDNPHGPVTGALTVSAFSVIERHRLIWIWLGDGENADRDAIPDLSFIDQAARHAISKGYMPTLADHRLLVDNILDLSHGDYLHAATLGGGSFTRAKVRMEEKGDTLAVEWRAERECAIPIWQPLLPTPDKLVDMTTRVVWHPTGIMKLDSVLVTAGADDGPVIKTWNAHIMTPETETSTHYFYCNVRNYRTNDAEYNAALADGLAAAFGGEDKPMIEAQQARIGVVDLLDLKPALLPIDAASTRARRIYRRLLLAESDKRRGPEANAIAD